LLKISERFRVKNVKGAFFDLQGDRKVAGYIEEIPPGEMVVVLLLQVFGRGLSRKGRAGDDIQFLQDITVAELFNDAGKKLMEIVVSSCRSGIADDRVSDPLTPKSMAKPWLWSTPA
jgi:hypothetical protein